VGGYTLPSQVTPVPGAGLILNGSKITSVKYPNAVQTELTGINNGFIYHGGTWAKVVYPQAPDINGTQLVGISNNNVIIGQAGSSPPTSFLHANGVFKIILAPNSGNTQVQGISGDGLITGVAFMNGVSAGSGFLATCQ
jgi:hypothetical protein